MLGRERANDTASSRRAGGLGKEAVDRRSPPYRPEVDVIAGSSYPSSLDGKKEAVIHRRGGVAAVQLERTLPQMQTSHLCVSDHHARLVDHLITQRQLTAGSGDAVKDLGDGIGRLVGCGAQIMNVQNVE